MWRLQRVNIIIDGCYHSYLFRYEERVGRVEALWVGQISR